MTTTPAKAQFATGNGDTDADDDVWADPAWQVDSATRQCCQGIGTHTRACTDIGPAPQPPAWCLPDATPEHGIATEQYGGGTLTTWDRIISDDVWIACIDQVVDSRVIRTAPRIHYTEPTGDGLDQAATLQLARELVAAANILTEANE